jgi:hypothetical protein
MMSVQVLKYPDREMRHKKGWPVYTVGIEAEKMIEQVSQTGIQKNKKNVEKVTTARPFAKRHLR